MNCKGNFNEIDITRDNLYCTFPEESGACSGKTLCVVHFEPTTTSVRCSCAEI